MSNITNEKSTLWLHAMRVTAIFMVVILHASGLILVESEFASYDWWVGNIYNAFTRMAVPIFFMISGYLLLTKEETATTFYRKRFGKVLLPFLIWTIFYSVWFHLYRDGSDYASYDWSSFDRHLLQPAYYHMWFLYVLSMFYLLMPLLKRLVNINKTSQLLWVVGIWFVGCYLVPIAYIAIAPSLLSETLRADISAALFIPSFYFLLIGYLYLGCYLGRLNVSKKQCVWALSVAAATYLVTIFGTFSITENNSGKLDEYFYYLSPTIVIYSSAWFVAMKYLFSKTCSDFLIKHTKLITTLSTVSFGIYLVHPVIMDFLNAGYLGVQLNSTSFEPILATAAYSLVTFISCALIVFYGHKVPVLKKAL